MGLPPRRKSDWVQTLLTGLVLTAAGYGAQGLSGLKENVSVLNLKVARWKPSSRTGKRSPPPRRGGC
jgi:hypothetical protein